MLFCFAPRFLLFSDWLPLACARFPFFADWLPFVLRTSSRPSLAASFCFARGFFYFRAHVRLSPETHSFVFVLIYLLFHALLRLISPLKFFCLNRSLPFVFEFSQTIGCERSSWSALCLANVLHCIFRPSSGFAYAMPFFFAIQDGVLLEVYGEMSSCWDATSRCFRDTVLERDSVCDQKFPAAILAARKRRNTGNKYIRLPNDKARPSKLEEQWLFTAFHGTLSRGRCATIFLNALDNR